MTNLARNVMATLVVAAAAFGTLGCGGGNHRPDPLAANRGLPMWTAELQRLFDDQLDPAAFGMSMSGTPPSRDPLLPLRTQAADVCARMRVQTVVRDSVGDNTRFELSMQVGVPTLMPARIDARTFLLTVGPHSGSFGLVQSMENTLGGHTFIGFVRRFAGAEGPEIHYHLTSDNEEVAKVIQQVALMEELAKQ